MTASGATAATSARTAPASRTSSRCAAIPCGRRPGADVRNVPATVQPSRPARRATARPRKPVTPVIRSVGTRRPYSMGVPSGTVLSLHRWPVKSLAGEAADALRLDARGIAGDRAHALFDEHKGAPRRLTVRQAPGMLRWSARYDALPGDALHPDAVPRPRLTAPDGAVFDWDDPRLGQALAADLGRAVALRRDLALMQDLGDSVLITTQATLDAVSGALGRPLDLRRFRTNIHVVLDAEAYAEERWEGRRLRVGDAELQLLHPCKHCVIPTRDPDSTAKDPEILRWLTREHGGLFGINARAHGEGRVAVGDQVELL